jgi:hypothetical protein
LSFYSSAQLLQFSNMKLYAAAVACVTLLAPLSAAWTVTIYDRHCDSEGARYYVVYGEGTFDFAPWTGPPWNGWIERCAYYFDGGSQGPFTCDGPNPDFIPQYSVVLEGQGWCTFMYEGGGRDMFDHECYEITAPGWGAVESLSCREDPGKTCHENPYYPGCPDAQGGNTYIDMSDTAVNFGSTHPSDAFEKLLEVCSTVGCHGDNTAEIQTTVVGNFNLDQRKIVVSAEATFNPTKEATREKMIELLQKMVKQSTQTRKVNWQDSDPIDPKTQEATEYYFTESLNLKASEDGETAFLNVMIKVEDSDTDNGFCSKAFAAAGAIGGAVSGVTGGAFGLAGLLCDR